VSLAAVPLPERARPGDFVAGRRQLFRRWVGRVAGEVQHAAQVPSVPEPVPDKAVRAARPYVTEQRELLQIVAKTKPPGPFLVREHETLPLLQLSLVDSCTACEACARACPTGAVQVRESDTEWALAFRLDDCVACEVCLEVCQPDALRALPAFDAAPRGTDTVLRALRKQRCQRCDRAFVSPAPAETCAICADDEEAFSAIFG
jgi:formate hydrogenlyase subunit 6/NADH:ubiquinone oxidoreductase subunit I